MAIFKALTFDGVNSLDYGIYITGEAVYNAPERAVEMVNIPGKNGALALDQGRFENIEVTYHAGCFADSQADFADKVMKFRNALASRYTYKRLTDEYHPDEYRLGLYKSGLEVDAVRYSTAGEFNITFDCKPQRFLLDGDAELSPTDYSDVHTVSGDIVQIDNDGSLGVKSVLTTIEPIQSGSGTPSPTNVRPISGHTECVTSVSGVNVWDEEWELGNIANATGATTADSNRIRCKNFIPVVGGQSYYFFCGAGNRLGLFAYDNDKAFLGVYYQGNFVIGRTSSSDLGSHTVTLPINCKYIKIKCTATYGTTYNHDISINYPSTDHEYHAYEGNTYTTDLGQTVYGGTLDVVSGELVVDRAMVTLDGSDHTFFNEVSQGATAEGNLYIAYIVNSRSGIKPDSVALSKSYEWVDANTTSLHRGQFNTVGSYSRFVIADQTLDTLAKWNAWLASNPMQLCYELATPQTYQLTPQQVQLLLGTNHLWSDGGEITVTYGVHPYYNPTPFASKPLIKVTGRGTLGIGEYILTITGAASQTLYIDCETMEIYTLEGTVPTGASSLVSINRNDFPVLEPGTNNISVGSGITAVTITPRWWRI